MEREQKLLILTGRQNTCGRPDLESIICSLVELDIGGFWGFPRKQVAQVGLHDPPVEGQLHVSAEPQRKKCCAAALRPSKSRFGGLRVVSNDELLLLHRVRVARADADEVLGSEISCLSRRGSLRFPGRR